MTDCGDDVINLSNELQRYGALYSGMSFEGHKFSSKEYCQVQKETHGREIHVLLTGL